MVGVTGGGGNFWASENLSGRVHFEGYSPEWRVLSKLSVQPCTSDRHLAWFCTQPFISEFFPKMARLGLLS